jgi:hypothetical protein
MLVTSELVRFPWFRLVPTFQVPMGASFYSLLDL